MEARFLTDIGQVRSHNEDSGGIFYNADGQMLVVVADGVGGHKAGDVASQMTTKHLQQKWESHEGLSTPQKIEDWINGTVKEANEAVFHKAKGDPELEGMGTTIVIAVCVDEFITVAHIGDSRCYIYKNDELKQITEDHSLVNELIRLGQISTADAEFHPRKNVVLRALGTEETVACDIQTMEWEKGNKLLLCSDGLTDKVNNGELKDFLSRTEQLNMVGEQLINLANERGGEDNISLAIIHHEATSRAGENG